MLVIWFLVLQACLFLMARLQAALPVRTSFALSSSRCVASQVVAIAGVDESSAREFLAARGWSVEGAIAALFGE